MKPKAVEYVVEYWLDGMDEWTRTIPLQRPRAESLEMKMHALGMKARVIKRTVTEEII